MSQLVENFDTDAESFSRNYLRTYFSGDTPDPDEQFNITFLIEQFRKLTEAPVLLDIGCGPTVTHVLPAEPHVSGFHMADYLPECLEEIRRWKNRERSAHNWNVFTRYTLQAEGEDPSEAAIRAREDRT